MPRFLVFSVYVAITIAAFSLAGCVREKTKKIVGFSQTENIGPWRVAETNSIKAEAANTVNVVAIVTKPTNQAIATDSTVKGIISC